MPVVLGAQWPHGLCTRLRIERSDPGSSPERGHGVVFSLHPGVQMDTGELNDGGNHAVD